MSSCFISYASPDQAIALSLKDSLAKFGVTAFVQEKDGRLGEDWQQSITLALGDARVVAVLVSVHTQAAIYQRGEVERAIALARAGRVRVVPIYMNGLDANDPATPLGLGSYHAVQLAREEDLPAIACELSKLLQADSRTVTPSGSEGQAPQAVTSWIAAARAAREARLLHPARPLPTQLVRARTAFEAWWEESGQADKRRVDGKVLQDALSLVVRLYRLQELKSNDKPSSLYWSEEAVRHFEQVSDRDLLVEALLDKAAVYLELSQIEHTEPDNFRRISEDGDSVMARATSIANASQRAQVFRIWSRFYQNLARPRTGRLSDDWDNDYLSVAYDKISRAAELEPKDRKTITQLARVAQRFGSNPPQSTDPEWSRKLRRVQQVLLVRFREEDESLTSPTERIPILNIIAVITLDVVRREASELAQPADPLVVEALVEELSRLAIAALREALALLPHTEWKREYDFDFHYDLGRLYCLRSAILSALSHVRAKADFAEALTCMAKARQGATTTQLDAALQAVDSDANLVLLGEEQRLQLRAVLSGTRPQTLPRAPG